MEKILTYDAGKSLILPWNTVEKIGKMIADKHFNTEDRKEQPVYFTDNRDDSSFNYSVSNLSENDKSKWEEIFRKYDTEESYDYESMFETGNIFCELPSSISIELMNEILPELKNILPEGYNNFKAKMAVATYHVLILFEKAPKECEDWLY